MIEPPTKRWQSVSNPALLPYPANLRQGIARVPSLQDRTRMSCPGRWPGSAFAAPAGLVRTTPCPSSSRHAPQAGERYVGFALMTNARNSAVGLYPKRTSRHGFGAGHANGDLGRRQPPALAHPLTLKRALAGRAGRDLKRDERICTVDGLRVSPEARQAHRVCRFRHWSVRTAPLAGLVGLSQHQRRHAFRWFRQAQPAGCVGHAQPAV